MFHLVPSFTTKTTMSHLYVDIIDDIFSLSMHYVTSSAIISLGQDYSSSTFQFNRIETKTPRKLCELRS